MEKPVEPGMGNGDSSIVVVVVVVLLFPGIRLPGIEDVTILVMLTGTVKVDIVVTPLEIVTVSVRPTEVDIAVVVVVVKYMV